MTYKARKFIGTKSGFLTVVGYEDKKFLCECRRCGKTVSVEPWYVVHGARTTCGSDDCFRAYMRQASSTHCLSKTRLYRTWNNMISRCYNPKHVSYKNYGARGITVCDEWRNDVLTFVVWAYANGYDDSLTIDRIDVNGNYEPSNCRWATYSEQARNKRDYVRPKRKATKHIWTIDGVTMGGKEWCKKFDIPFTTVLYRINKYGLDPETALKMDKIQEGRPRKAIDE